MIRWIAACSLLGFLSISLPIWAQESVGKISTLKPQKNFELTLTRKGSPVPEVGKNTAVFVGDVIQTGAKTQVIVRFNDGNTLLIRQSSKMTVEIYEQKTKGRIRTEGIIHGLIDNAYEGSAENSFEFTSSSAIAGVRGSIIGVHVNPQNQRLTAYLQEGARPAYIRPPDSRQLTDFAPNRVASGSRDVGFQVVTFNDQVHGALKLPQDVIQAVQTDNPTVLENALEQSTELESTNTETLDSGTPPETTQEAPDQEGATESTEGTAQETVSLDVAEDSSGESFFPELGRGKSESAPGITATTGGGSLADLFKKMRTKAMDRFEIAVDAAKTTTLKELSPTTFKLQDLKSIIEKLREQVQKETKQQRDVENSKIKVKVTFK